MYRNSVTEVEIKSTFLLLFIHCLLAGAEVSLGYVVRNTPGFGVYLKWKGYLFMDF